jgi:hypothetical protein
MNRKTTRKDDMTSPAQRHFDFDLSTLNMCIASLKPKPLRTLFRGLLLTAAMEPRRVSDIDDSGFVLMVAPIQTVANWAGVSDRAIQRSRDLHNDLVQHSAGPNTASEWFFNLRSALPDSAIGWFRDLVDTAEMSPRHSENVTPTKRKCHPDILQNVTPTKPNLSSMCLVLNTARLASLAGICDRLGVAVSRDATTIEALSLDPDGLRSAAVVDCLHELLTESGYLPTTMATRNRFFNVAAKASRQDTPWPWLRRSILAGWFHETEVSSADAATGRRQRMQADELRKASQALAATSTAAVITCSGSGPAPELLRPLTAADAALSPFARKALQSREVRRQSPAQAIVGPEDPESSVSVESPR